MEDEDKLRSDVERGRRAKVLLEDPVLTDTFVYLKQSYVDKWMACKTPELRESAWYLVKSLEQIHDHLVTVLNDGRLADRQIDELVQAETRKRRAA